MTPTTRADTQVSRDQLVAAIDAVEAAVASWRVWMASHPMGVILGWRAMAIVIP